MSMNLSIYVGPYLEVEKTFDLYGFGFDSRLSDGRMQAAGEDEPWILILSDAMPGVERQMHWGRYDDDAVASLLPGTIAEEINRFSEVAKGILNYCAVREIAATVKWGVVPRWS